MKKLSILLLIVLTACTTAPTNEIVEEPIEEEVVQTEEVDYKHTVYIKDYIGKNCASLGYTSIGGERYDYLGDTLIKLIFATSDGSYVDIEDEETLQQYVVVEQNLEPNTEVKLGFCIDEDGNEYDNLVNWQSYEEIILRVKKIDEEANFTDNLVVTKPSIDRYTYYIPDFTGRNLFTCGYISMSGNLWYKIGEAKIKVIIVTEDGSYVEIDSEQLKNYVVYDQSIKPDSEFKIIYEVDSEGNEYDNLVDHQTFDEIDLYVRKIQ